jgi:hypothetical protein
MCGTGYRACYTGEQIDDYQECALSNCRRMAIAGG